MLWRVARSFSVGTSELQISLKLKGMKEYGKLYNSKAAMVLHKS